MYGRDVRVLIGLVFVFAGAWFGIAPRAAGLIALVVGTAIVLWREKS